MSQLLDFAVPALLIGVLATALADLCALLQKRVLGMQVANWPLVGRWFGYIFLKGQWRHASIARAPALAGEGLIGWGAHYLIGVLYAGLLLALCGIDWAASPSLLPALAVGLGTLVAPFLLMQPGMGLGVAASNTPQPNAARLRSVLAHGIFGLSLYVAAQLVAPLI
ncbi:DUF2938 domain-containing protein [Pseudomonas sp. SDI]|uniref:DUF2938 family protein n=1 Tax=Pseudomonas sp. SDI TaxID=2170734 RepID=UPI000DE6F936|nr:DUF2938 family protein [Pseudomonas sp. SDI]PWB31421.1 DUF2938 domain-containing protein [Pseudomonas sp. SDI]